MSNEPEDIDRLLREVEAMNVGQPPATRPDAQPPAAPAGPPTATGRGRGAWTGVGAVGGLAAGGLVGTVLAFLPSVGPLQTAVGAALGGAVMAFASGPPDWFRRR